MNNQPLEHSHSREAIAARVSDHGSHSYLSDFVYGAIDGTVTTFAVVSGVAGAGLSPDIVIVLGLANLFGDGFSMAAGNYLGTRTNRQLLDKARAMEERHIRQEPEGERLEIREIFAAKGFRGTDLDRAVEIITSDRQRWIDTMLVDELGLSLTEPSPVKAGLTTFAAFCLVGLLPLLAFICGFFIDVDHYLLFAASTAITGIAFFVIGAAKSYFVDQHWFWSGLETLGVGGVAAALAYVVGLFLSGIV